MVEEMAISIEFVVTLTHVKEVVTLEFLMTNRESLDTSIHPFVFSHHNAEEQEER